MTLKNKLLLIVLSLTIISMVLILFTILGIVFGVLANMTIVIVGIIILAALKVTIWGTLAFIEYKERKSIILSLLLLFFNMGILVGGITIF